MNWNSWIRQIHRWLSIVFTVTVIANFIALAQGGGMPPPWITYSPLPPLALQLFTGLYLFMLPYAARWRTREEIERARGVTRRRTHRQATDWRTNTLGRMRKLINEADPDVVEEVEVGQGHQRAGIPPGRTTGSSAPARRTRPS